MQIVFEAPRIASEDSYWEIQSSSRYRLEGIFSKFFGPPWSIWLSWKLQQNHLYWWSFPHRIVRGDPVLVCEFLFPVLSQKSQIGPWPRYFEKYRDTPPIFIAILLQKYALFLAQKVVYTPPICITIRLPLYRDALAEVFRERESGCAKGAAKGSCGETVVQKGVFGESVSSLLP